MSLEVCCCSSNLRFNLYGILYSAFFCFLTASMLISAILVTRCACATLDSFCFCSLCDVTNSVRCMCGEQGLTSRTRYGVCAVSKVIRNNRAVRHIHVKTHFPFIRHNSGRVSIFILQSIILLNPSFALNTETNRVEYPL
jgi:hypothetical protein